MIERLKIPKEIKRKVLLEAGHRCAIPTCKYARVDIAHIIPWSESQDNSFENLIALCPNCHDLYDKDKKIDHKSMQIYKQNLGLLNHRYGEIKRRILDYFYESNNISICLPALHEIHVLFPLKDKFLIKTKKPGRILIQSGGLTVPIWEEYTLTDKGKIFIENLK